MSQIKFSWDENKNEQNIRKHKISFAEAKSVFYDNFARIIHDPDHSEMEDRYLILGLSESLRILVVVHCYYKFSEEIRIISARIATKKEKLQYNELRK